MSEFAKMSVKVEKRVRNESITFQSWISHKPINTWHFHQSSHSYWCQNNATADIEIPQEGKTRGNRTKQSSHNKGRKETDNGSYMG